MRSKPEWVTMTASQFLGRFVEQTGHVVEVHAAAFVQRDEQRFFG